MVVQLPFPCHIGSSVSVKMVVVVVMVMVLRLPAADVF